MTEREGPVAVEELALEHGGVPHLLRQLFTEKKVEVDANDRVDAKKAASVLKGWKPPHKKPAE